MDFSSITSKTFYGKRFSRLEVPQPRVFSNYNSYMGGMDLLDQATNNYRISIKGKKCNKGKCLEIVPTC
jgi:hypothetical protein